MTVNQKYLAVAFAVFVAQTIYIQLANDERIDRVENTVLAIAEDVQDIKQAIIIERTERDTTTIKYSKQDFDCLARNIYYEAGIEDRVGKIAVAQVTLNRLRTGYWGSNICKVVYAPAQFSWTQIKRRAWMPNVGPSWEESQQVAAEVLDKGTRIATLKTSLFYHADYVSPYWRDGSKRVAHIGQHIFYTQAKGGTLKL
jgi:spore germination cell wall hydrolase CwlJ-like protein